MNAYVLSFLVFAAAANTVALPLIYFERRKGQHCHPAEYMIIYLTWFAFVVSLSFIFHGLNAAFVEWKIDATSRTGFFVVAGVLGGLSLLPKLFLVRRNVNPMLITIQTSIFVALAFTTFSGIFFSFTGGS